MKMRLFFFTAVLVFIAGSLTYLHSVAEIEAVERHENSSFVITYSRSNSSKPAEVEMRVQAVRSGRESLIKRVGNDGTDIEHSVTRFSPEEWKNWSGGRERYERSNHVVRKEQIVGLTAYVFRQDLGSGQTLERWYAPETGPVFLKEVIENGDGTALVTEAVNIEFREISIEEVRPQENLVSKDPRKNPNIID